MGEPEKIVFSLWDEMPLKPKRIYTRAAKKAMEERTKSQVWDLVHAEVRVVFDQPEG